MSVILEREFKLHFRGNRTAFDPDNIVGPNTHNEFLRPVRAELDADADRTTIWYELVPKADLPAHGEKAVANINQMIKIWELFTKENDNVNV